MSRFPNNFRQSRQRVGIAALRPLRIARALPGMLLSGEPDAAVTMRYIAGDRGADGWVRAEVWPSPNYFGLIWAAVVTRYADGRRELTDEPINEALLRQPCLPLMPACRRQKLMWSVLTWYDAEELLDSDPDWCSNCGRYELSAAARQTGSFGFNHRRNCVNGQLADGISRTFPGCYRQPAGYGSCQDGSQFKASRRRARVLLRYEEFRWEPQIIEPLAYDRDAVKPLRWRISNGM